MQWQNFPHYKHAADAFCMQNRIKDGM